MKVLKKSWKGAVLTARLLRALAVGFGRTVWDKKGVILVVGLVAFGLYSLISHAIQETAELNSIERADRKCQEKAEFLGTEGKLFEGRCYVKGWGEAPLFPGHSK